ncbi:4756_t:CDS:2 [Cetraspora pellucida]|uniref:4756_t:CDS:1 n=1 Tax=Cetraspora pellucida TaxID=1433469 RepID=A0ACA9LTN2_9GLOM|nr:4756_t:CDS:2 [Cetraspora pellucida]
MLANELPGENKYATFPCQLPNLHDWYNEIHDNKNTLFTQQLQETKAHNQSLPEEIRFPKYEIHPKTSYHSKPINTKQITQLLQQKVSEQCVSGDLDLNLDSFGLTKLNIQEDQSETSLQSQIEIPPKNN